MASKNIFFLHLSEMIVKFKASKNLTDRLKIASNYIKLQKKHSRLLEYHSSLGTPEFEVWRNIKGYEGVYQVSNFGRIKALEGFFIKTKKGGKSKMAVYKTEKIRAEKRTPNGYLNISLWKCEKVEHVLVHRIVAFYFIPNPQKHTYVLHIDDNPGNPHFKNLKWGTQSENIKDCSNKNRGFRGMKNNLAKLTEDNVREIRRLLISGKSAYSTAPMFGVSKTAILSIKHGRTWSHVKH